ncbi:histidine phosphatase family protein [Paenibacillus koleovorans]|uniref:histidine phosphatase family protein n=1 Tax=Paenibacillus koleovorans TaxID=121608 RepID=UPI000FD8BE0D|nr:histidine phosphatase family protein [Paenibacillus koleovorans]
MRRRVGHRRHSQSCQIRSGFLGLKLAKEIATDEYILYSSDLMRANQTAEIVGNHLGLNVIEEQDLREINTGIAAGKTKEWARANRNPRTGTGFDIDYQEFHEGETWRQFFTRVCNCMDKIYNSEQKNLIIVTHGGTLGYIIAWWMNFQTEMLSRAYYLASVGSISILQTNIFSQHALHKFNDTSHLSELIVNLEEN